MGEDDELRQKLIQRIEAKRVKINAFGRELERSGCPERRIKSGTSNTPNIA